MALSFDDIEKRIQKGIDEENRKLEAARKETARKRAAETVTQQIPYAKKTTGGKNRTSGSSIYSGETMAEKKGIKKRQLPIPYAQSDAKSIAQFAGQAAYTGLTGLNKMLAQTADFFLPDFATPSFAQKTINYYKKVGDEQEKKLQSMQTTKGKEIAGQLIQGTVQALPNAALAVMSGGASLGAQGASIGAQTGAKALQASAQQALKNPAFWTSFLQTAGPTYEKEKEQGASETRATASAMVNALIGSAIEMGGGIEKFNPNQGVMKSLIKTAGEEGLEEMKQYSAENLVNKALGSNTAKWFSTDQNEDAVINPKAQAIQGAYGAGIGAIMGGGQRAAFAGLQKASKIPYAKTEGEPQAEVETPEDIVQNAASGKELHGMRLSTQAQEKVIAAVEKRIGAKVTYADLPEGIDGMYENGVITISNTAKNPAYTVLKHELTHHIESSGNYQELSNFIQSSMQSAGYDVQAAMQKIIDDYASIGKELTYEEASREFTAKFAEEYLFNSEKSIERLARENPNIFRQIYDWIVDTIHKIGASDETKFLIDAQRKYEKALRTVGKVDGNTKMQLSISDINSTYDEAIQNEDNAALRQMVKDAAKEAGYNKKLYHQTGAAFTEFNTENAAAGKYDSELPTGIFMKPDSNDIGLKGKTQMELYSKIQNPLRFRDRADAVRFWEREIPGYKEANDRIKAIDNEYQAKYNDVDSADDITYAALHKQLTNGEITREEFKVQLEEAVKNTQKILDYWENASNEARLEAKRLIDDYIASSGYDGMIVDNDTGSFGRNVNTYISFNPNNVKSADPVTYNKNLEPIPLSDRFNPNNSDIRYALNKSTVAETEYTERLRRASTSLYGEEGNKYLDTRIGRKTPISPFDEGFAEAAAEKPTVKGQKKAEGYQKRANRDFVETVKESLGVNKFSDSKRIRSMTEDTVKKLEEGSLTTADRDRLFDEMFAEGVLVDEQFYRQYANLKQTIRNTQLHVTEDIRRNVTDFNAFRTHNLNTVRLSNDSGAEIDVFYDELRTEYPELFPELNTPAEMLERISEVGKSIKKTETRLSDLSGADWEETYNSARKSFDTALNELEEQVNIVKKYLQNKEEISVEDAKQRIGDIKRMRREVEKIKGKVLLAESDKEWIEKLHQGRATEKMVRTLEPNAEAILTVYEAEKPLRATEKALKSIGQEQRKSDMDTAEAILEGSENWKDKRGLAYGRETAERNMVDVAGKEKGKELIETYFRPVHDNEALAVRMKKELQNVIREKKISIKKAFDITDLVIDAPGLTEKLREARSKGKRVKVSESTLLQLYGEKIIEEGTLRKLGADVEKISSTATVMRNIYNQLIDAANAELVRFGYEPIEYRKDYFPHFTEDKPDGVLAKAASALGFNIQRDELPADISGLTHTFRPGKKWFRNALSRTSEVTEYDAIKGFDIYLEGISDVIFHTEDIQKLRALENAIRYKHGSDGMKKQIEEVRNAPDLSEMDKEARLETIYRNGDSQLGSLATWIRNYTDTLAGKKSQIDRVFEHNLGRGLYNTSKAIENRVAANMVAINPGSWLTNFIPLVQGSEVKNSNIIRGMAQTVQNMFRNDGFTDMSTFITNRKGSDVLWKSTKEVWQDIATKPMQWIDEFVSESLVRARYLEEIENGKSVNEAMNLADDFAASVIADRSKGALPTVFNAKNPVSKILTMYQVEVNNQWSHLFKDIPRTEENVMKVAMSFAKFAIGAYLFDDIFEWLVGRRPALDPISWVNDYVGDTTGKKLPNFIDALIDAAKGEGFHLEEVDKKKGGAALAGLGKNVAENIPFVGGVIGGGRVPIQSALPDVTTVGTAFGNIINGDGTKKDYYNLIKEAEKPATYILPPFGGGQLKKIGETARNVVQGGSFGMDSEGNQTLRFAVDNTPWQLLQSASFGQYSAGNSRDYVESGFKSLSAKPTNAYKALTASGMKPTEAEKLIRTILKSKKKTQQVNELIASSLTPDQKNAVGKALWPEDARDYGNQLQYNYSKMPDSQKQKINALTGTGMSQERAMSAYETYKDYEKSIEQAVALMEESYTKDVLAALGISDETAEKASVLHDAGFGVNDYRMAWNMANTNGDSGVSMEEAKAYLDSRTAMSRQEKYAMFKALTGCKDKNNPYR